jgi:hypothetical protein
MAAIIPLVANAAPQGSTAHGSKFQAMSPSPVPL